MAERVRELRIHHPRSAVLRYVSVSVGVCAAVPEADDSPATLVEKSQQQLQIAKKSGAIGRLEKRRCAIHPRHRASARGALRLWLVERHEGPPDLARRSSSTRATAMRSSTAGCA